jgi:hypothetical protein
MAMQFYADQSYLLGSSDLRQKRAASMLWPGKKSSCGDQGIEMMSTDKKRKLRVT